METKNQLATVQRMTPNFVQNALESIESVMKYAEILLKSKLVPNHFYEKGADGKPDFTKGKPEAIVMVVQHGSELGLSVSQSLQQVVPVNGLMSVKGDGAKSLILTSGLCETWEETSTGSIEEGNFAYEIYSKRKDGKEKRGKFSLTEAIRADLFYTDSQLKAMQSSGDWQQKKANAFKYSAWYKYPTRMVMYRCIGFISRDLYPDVLQGLVTTEEANDYKEEGVVSIETGTGKKMTMKESQFEGLQNRSEAISQSVISKIDKANGAHKEEPIQEAEVVPDNPPAEETKPKVWTVEELTEMKEDIYEKIKGILPKDKVTILESLKGRRSNKLYRDAVLYFQNGNLDAWLMGEMSRREKAEKEEVAAGTQAVKIPENKTGLVVENNPADSSDIDKVFEQKPGGISTAQATASFEAQRSVQQPALFPEENEDGFVIPPLKDNGKRVWSDLIKLSRYLQDKGVDKSTVQGKWEDFLTTATNEQILALIPK